MELEEKIRYMKALGGSEVKEEDDDTLETYLLLAEKKLIEHIYPHDKDVVTLDSRYEMKQIELANILYLKRGAEGESSHSENGVARKYLTEQEFLQSIPRECGIPK